MMTARSADRIATVDEESRLKKWTIDTSVTKQLRSSDVGKNRYEEMDKELQLKRHEV